jgi:hypothetical protein
MKLSRTFDDEVILLRCDECGQSYWVQTLLNDSIVDQITEICCYCGGETHKAVEDEIKYFIEMHREGV